MKKIIDYPIREYIVTNFIHFYSVDIFGPFRDHCVVSMEYNCKFLELSEYISITQDIYVQKTVLNMHKRR